MIQYIPILQKINSGLFSERGVDVFVLRLDLIHPKINGNKWFKLKYNLEEAKKLGKDTILTFGGAFSNHIHATAAACKQLGLKSIGVIRGEEEYSNNDTLSDAVKMGMKLHFVNRGDYRRKNEPGYLADLKSKLGDFYTVPEGGNNYLGSLGCAEILSSMDGFDYVFCSVGTSATFCGLAKSISNSQHLIGISVLKGEGSLVVEAQARVNEIRGKDDLKIYITKELLSDTFLSKSGIINNYHFGGFARHTKDLLDFKTDFEKQYKLPLDYVYESKLFYAVSDLIKAKKIPFNSKVIVIHGGGLQGNAGYEKRYALNANRKVNDPQG